MYLRCDQCDEPIRDFAATHCVKCGAKIPDIEDKRSLYDRWYDPDTEPDDAN